MNADSETSRPGPQPISKDEADRWRRKDVWGLHEAALLLCGYQPGTRKVDFALWAYERPSLRADLEELCEAEDALGRAIAAGYLRRYRWGAEGAVLPEEVIAWADPHRFPQFPFLGAGGALRNAPASPVLDARKLADIQRAYDAIRAHAGKEPSKRAVTEKSGYDRETVAKYWRQLKRATQPK